MRKRNLRISNNPKCMCTQFSICWIAAWYSFESFSSHLHHLIDFIVVFALVHLYRTDVHLISLYSGKIRHHHHNQSAYFLLFNYWSDTRKSNKKNIIKTMRWAQLNFNKLFSFSSLELSHHCLLLFILYKKMSMLFHLLYHHQSSMIINTLTTIIELSISVMFISLR